MDKDEQAVEVARLNLMLKALHARDRLPKLDNIRQGDSLNSGTAKELEEYFGKNWKEKNPFNWDNEFKKVMEDGKFDVIVGNPPWGADFTEEEKLYLYRHYSLNSGKFESYIHFIERATSLLRDEGYFGFIIPSYWISRSQTKALRNHLFGQLTPVSFIVLPENVFPDFKMDSCIIIARKRVPQRDPMAIISVGEVNPERFSRNFTAENLKESTSTTTVGQWLENPHTRFNPRISRDDTNLVVKIEKDTVPLGEICEVSQGLTLYRRSTLAKLYGEKKADEIVTERLFHATRKENKTFKKELVGRDVSRYSVNWTGKSWVSYGPWLAHAVDERFFRGPRLVVQKIRNPTLKQRLVAAYLEDDETYSAGVLLNVILKKPAKYSLLYVLGLANSKLLNFWYRERILDVSIRVVDLKQLPIRRVNFDDLGEKQKHDAVVGLVEEMLELQKDYGEAEREKWDKRDSLKRRIDEVDTEIDRAVYQLYGLTEEEIRIVEKDRLPR